MLLILFFLRLIVASCAVFIVRTGSAGRLRSFFFLPLLYILCVVLLLLTKLTNSFTFLFPFFCLFILPA
jgi:hypothetical protein